MFMSKILYFVLSWSLMCFVLSLGFQILKRTMIGRSITLTWMITTSIFTFTYRMFYRANVKVYNLIAPLYKLEPIEDKYSKEYLKRERQRLNKKVVNFPGTYSPNIKGKGKRK